MTTEISTQPVEINFTQANVLIAGGNVVINDPSNTPADTNNFFGTIMYHSVQSNVGKYSEHVKSQWNLSADSVILTYTND